MPQLVALHKRNDDKPFVMIGMHCQNAKSEEVQKTVKQLKMKFPVVDNGNVPGGGGGIPHTVVFDAKGKSVFSGHPAEPEFEKAVRKALKEAGEAKPEDKPAASAAPAILVPERTWTNKEGKTMVAALEKVADGTGTFLMKGGKKVPLKVDLLSVDDQAVIEKAQKAASTPPATPATTAK